MISQCIICKHKFLIDGLGEKEVYGIKATTDCNNNLIVDDLGQDITLAKKISKCIVDNAVSETNFFEVVEDMVAEFYDM